MKITESKFEIKDTENYYNLVNMYANAQSVVANVPKFMPQIPIAKPKNTIGRINRSMFCNDIECKPQPSTTIPLQNFITIVQHPSRQIYLGSKINMGGNNIKKFTKLTLGVMHGDIRKLYITDKE